MMIELTGSFAVADPGFPVGGVDLVGGMDSQGGYISKILYTEYERIRTLRQACAGQAPLDSPMICLT